MTQGAIRFHPPRVALTPALRWMLLRAFGPPGAPFAEPVDPGQALEAARRFELSARIASRQGRKRLLDELGAGAGAGFARDRAEVAAFGMRLLELAGEVARVAAEIGAPVAFLKFVALEWSGIPAAGARAAGDVDVLAPAARAAELQRALLARGFRASGAAAAEHQLPALVHPQGGAVEVHLHLPGVKPGGRPAGGAGGAGGADRGNSATFEELDALGLLLPLDGVAGRGLAPSPPALAAHALVHGLGQHGFWPDSYPLFRMVADLMDLGFGDGRAPLSELGARQAAEWVAGDVPPAEAGAVRALCRALAEGREPEGWIDEAPEGRLLRHLLAGRLAPDYAASLRLGLFHPPPGEGGRARRLARSVAGALWLTRAQIDALYGPPRHPLGYWGRRLVRPFDLMGRLVRYGAARRRVRR